MNIKTQFMQMRLYMTTMIIIPIREAIEYLYANSTRMRRPITPILMKNNKRERISHLPIGFTSVSIPYFLQPNQVKRQSATLSI